MTSNEGGYGTIPNDTAGWQPIAMWAFAPRDGTVPFELWGNRVKSSSPDSETLVRYPLESLKAIPGVTDATRVTTVIINHDQTLARVHLFALAIVTDEGRSVTLVLYKQSQ